VLTEYDNRLPYAWLGIIAEVPPSTEEIIYALHERGFAGHMLRTPTVSRFYLQCEPDDDVANWPDERIWFELRTRLATNDGWRLQEGPILEKSISEMRSFVVEPMRYRRLFLAGDSAHIVPPSGAKGMNLAISDARLLADALIAHYQENDDRPLDHYSEDCLRRVWRVQEFSTWMSWMIHRIPDHLPDADFRRKLQHSQLRYHVSSEAAMRSFAENYLGLEDC
jgi:p-hydroxybenzoate 3-monooxygenase